MKCPLVSHMQSVGFLKQRLLHVCISKFFNWKISLFTSLTNSICCMSMGAFLFLPYTSFFYFFRYASVWTVSLPR